MAWEQGGLDSLIIVLDVHLVYIIEEGLGVKVSCMGIVMCLMPFM
jgi:hypothetical protein